MRGVKVYMNVFDAIIQGAVQGLTEFLPVSSSGHLFISQHILGVSENNLFFNVMLHIGTLISVITFYHKKISQLIVAFFKVLDDIVRGKAKPKKIDSDKNFVTMIIIGLLPLFLLFLPVAPDSLDVKGLAENLSNSNYLLVPGIFLLATAGLLYIGTKIEKKLSKNNLIKDKTKLSFNRPKKYMNAYDALWIGFAQFLAAIFPGLSRSGSTLSAGLIRGINKQTALDYSFILGIPAVIAAALLELKDAFEMGVIYEVSKLSLFVGMLTSAIVGFLAIKLFKWFLSTDKMWIFILYAAVVGVLATVIGIIEIMLGINLFTGMPI